MEETRTTAEVANSAISDGTMPLTVNRNARIRERILSGEKFQLKSERYPRTYCIQHLEKDLYTLNVENYFAALVNRNAFLEDGFSVVITIFNISQSYIVFYEDVVFVNQSRKGGRDE